MLTRKDIKDHLTKGLSVEVCNAWTVKSNYYICYSGCCDSPLDGVVDALDTIDLFCNKDYSEVELCKE